MGKALYGYTGGMGNANPPRPTDRHAGPALGMRWLLLVVSLVLHGVLLTAIDGGLRKGAGAVPPAIVLTALLTAAPPVPPPETAPAAPAPAPPPKPVPKPRARPRPKPRAPRPIPQPAPESRSESDPAAAPESATATSLSSNAIQEAPAPDAPATAAAEAATPAPPVETEAGKSSMPSPEAPAVAAAPGALAGPSSAAPAAKTYKVSPPPSATLSYEVRYATRGSITRGSSIIDWRTDGATYAIRGEVSKFGFTLSSFRSEGGMDAAGVAPVLYAEKNARRAETNTHFQRGAKQVISFSASTVSFPLLPGAEDRASVVWQLAAIARGEPGVLAPGAAFDILVAGVRDAEHWLIEVVGEETVTLENGDARTWHLVRAPRAGTHDKRIDIWLAPAQHWYPVKLRYTEVSGDYLDLSLAGVN